ncbi:aminotransferase class III-fold pyridoxal phosphate-dependent enzyme [Candidatus Uabimicrobium amorphum]|uniref:Diaminobutyrate--pyruvate aminotransferase n=1 Tax=Uabimicrobium amorphum TaxID=2596890 RepID=A0A5S9IQD8_UABAM|nr:aminotransferase class III-fold pyridoxal phosphate-dependent enzyme [Candidatus Uabimicrobium amorphum]BBM85541.1 diaminobutyrate--pyruvate aminotransferase [Candidatus Uabimicrobium amorphum]
MKFDVVLSSPKSLPQDSKYNSIIDMIFSTPNSENTSIIVGANAVHDNPIHLHDIQNAVYRTYNWCRAKQIHPGDTVAILHFPHTSEIPLAMCLLAFLACRVRVYLPQHNHHVDFALTATKAIIGVLHEYTPQQRQQLKDRYDVDLYCAHRDLDIFSPTNRITIPPNDNDDEAIVFSTSGTTKRPKLVCYTHRALINSCKAWEAAGLFAEQTTGGNSFCPTLSHTMGVRNLLGALWTRKHTLFIYREWLQNPDKIEKWLLEFPPQHITCGSALFLMLHKLKEQSSALRSTLNIHLRCIVASGCDIATNLEKLFPNARVANAFGTTETQQVMNTLLQNDADNKSLGEILPGVQIAIRHTKNNNGQLFVNSPFAAKKYLGSKLFSPWIATGDIVEHNEKKVYFVSRENDTVVNSGLGVKLPLATIESEYSNILAQYPKIFYTHPKNIGILALVFTTAKNIEKLKRQAQSELLACYQKNEFLRANTPLRAIGIIDDDVPLSGVGKIDRSQIQNRFVDFCDLVADEERHSPCKIYLQDEQHAYNTHIPYLGNLLHTLRLNRVYQSAQGNYLYTHNEKILDFVGGFSCNLLGYHHEIISKLLQNSPPFFFDQGNIRHHATLLSQELTKIMAHITGKTYVACWASTGSEAVEIALKHAWFEQQNTWQHIQKKIQQLFVPQHIKRKCLQSYEQIKQPPVLIALKGSFHGRTLGAMQVLHEEKQGVFSNLFATKTIFIDETTDLPQIKKQHEMELLYPKFSQNGWTCAPFITSRIFAIVVEPIQGEGGIREISTQLLNDLQQFTAPLIIDEIQSGLGRSGSFLASSPVVADYYILGKALGASAAKISVTLIEKSHYQEKFDLQRTSTFYEDAFSCSIALKVLQIIQQDNIAQRCLTIGKILREKLQVLHNRYPNVLCEIRGRGCIMGIKLQYSGNHYLFKQLIAQQIGYFASSYLLHHHSIRVLPTSSAPDVLRIQPSAYTSEDELDQLINALENLCEILQQSAVTKLVGHLADLPQYSLEVNSPSIQHEVAAENSQRIAFIHHPLSIVRELLAQFPQCSKLKAQEKRQLSTKLCELFQLRPLETFRKNIHNSKLWLTGIALPAPPAFFKHSLLNNEIQLIEERLQQAIDLAVKNECRTLILGAYTSIIAQRSDKIHVPQHVQISSGNTYTLSLAWNDLNIALDKSKKVLQESTIGIVGALGNIGRGYCKLLYKNNCADLLLIGSPYSATRLEKFRDELGSGQITTDLYALRDCDIIIVVSNHNAPIVFPQHIATDKQVLLQDLSQPANSDRSIRKCVNVNFLSPGLVRLPHDKNFRLSLSLPRGVCFACCAEGILLALSGHKLKPSWEIDPQDAVKLLEEGKKQQLTTTVPSFF